MSVSTKPTLHYYSSIDPQHWVTYVKAPNDGSTICAISAQIYAHLHKLKQQSRKLAAMLLLSLEETTGPQRSLIINRDVETEENGILMWADLIKHFEKGSKEIRVGPPTGL